MDRWLMLLGRVAGASGVVVVLLAFALRLAGQWHIGSLQIGTLLMAGIALVVMGCLGYAAALAERQR